MSNKIFYQNKWWQQHSTKTDETSFEI